MERAGVPWKEASFVSIGDRFERGRRNALGRRARRRSSISIPRSTRSLMRAMRGSSPTAAPRKAPRRRSAARISPICLYCQDRVREGQSKHRAGDRERHRPCDAMAAHGVDRRHHQVAAARILSGRREALSQVAGEESAAFQWDGIVSNAAVKSVWDSISVLEPDFKAAKIDMDRTYDNSADRAGACQIPRAAEQLTDGFAALPFLEYFR
jgi:hypothetical protein